jgi:hypothetical protein
LVVAGFVGGRLSCSDGGEEQSGDEEAHA